MSVFHFLADRFQQTGKNLLGHTSHADIHHGHDYIDALLTQMENAGFTQPFLSLSDTAYAQAKKHSQDNWLHSILPKKMTTPKLGLLLVRENKAALIGVRRIVIYCPDRFPTINRIRIGLMENPHKTAHESFIGEISLRDYLHPTRRDGVKSPVKTLRQWIGLLDFPRPSITAPHKPQPVKEQPITTNLNT